MPILDLGGECCLCPTPLGAQDCNDLQTGIAEAYYTCPKNVVSLTFAADSETCTTEAEITSFALQEATPGSPLPSELLQPINFVKLDDDSGAVHEFDDTSEDGNVILNHTFRFKVVANTPLETTAMRKMLGREVCLVIKYKSGRWRFINYSGGMIARQVAGNSNQSWTEVVVSGRVNDLPLYISYTDGGTWADANLIPNSLGGLINA